MKYKLYAVLATGLVFGLASCREATETEETPTEETPTEQTPTDETASPAKPVAMSEVANQISGKLLRYDAATKSFIEANVDGTIDYYLISLSASW